MRALYPIVLEYSYLLGLSCLNRLVSNNTVVQLLSKSILPLTPDIDTDIVMYYPLLPLSMD